MAMIVKMLFGSHLYGTATPASDRDYKGIMLPTWKQVCTGRIPKHMEHSSTGNPNGKNTAEDVDTEIFSLHQFIKLAIEGQTVAMDMLHAPAGMLLTNSTLWSQIKQHRKFFYSKNIHSFLGYAIGQAAKYGVKGSRLNDAAAVLEWLLNQPIKQKLIDCDLSTFPTGEHIKKVERGFEVCGKQLQSTCKVDYLADIVNKFYTNYGERARQAARDEGIDWKAISHAFRAAYQMRELFSEGAITFPRPEAAFLTEIKTGQRKYLEVAPILEELIDEVKVLRDASNLPENPDLNFWDEFLTYVVEEHIRK